MSKHLGVARALALAFFAPLLLIGCVAQPPPEVADAELVGSWVHEFGNGPVAMMTFSADGRVVLVDIPAVVFASDASGFDISRIDWEDRVTADATWLNVRNPCCSQYPYTPLQIPEMGNSIVVLKVDHYSSPIELFFWYGPLEDELMLRFKRVE